MGFRHGILPYVLLVREALKAPTSIQALVIPVGYLPAPGDEARLWKTPHAFYVRYREIKLKLSWKLPSSWRDVLVTEDAMHAILGEKASGS